MDAALETSPDDVPKAVGALVIGGGPSGYTAAMALSKHGFKDIVILERSQSAGFFDPTMGFIYNISGPGREALAHIGIDHIQELGLTRRGMSVKYLQLDGSVKDQSGFLGANESDDLTEEEERQVGTWLHRHAFNEALYQHACEHHAQTIQVEFSTKVERVQLPEEDGAPLLVTAATLREGTKQPELTTFTCRLLVAADGANSIVRRALAAAQPGAGWEMKQFPSDSGDLVYKVLPLPPCPTLLTSAGPLVNTQSTVVPGKSIGGAHPLRLGLLAVKDLEAPRTANFILWPDHPFWDISTTQELYSYLEESFPQLDRLRENIPEDVAQTFVDARPGSFKQPQTCDRLVAEFPGAAEPAVREGDAATGLKGATVMILGDAAHAFPPDIGQGVNAALLDVLTLSESLEASPADLSAALREYEATRVGENKALVRMMQFAFPYQYRQAGMKLQSTLWGLNTALRLALSTVLPQVFAPSVAVMVGFGNKQHTGPWSTLYRDTLARGNRTTRNLFLLLGAVVAAAVAALAPMAVG